MPQSRVGHVIVAHEHEKMHLIKRSSYNKKHARHTGKIVSQNSVTKNQPYKLKYLKICLLTVFKAAYALSH